jgi:2-polyprenyl-3-methyl-5-hydroxy-6-metoxy-1,4-benzoquinol methylase
MIENCKNNCTICGKKHSKFIFKKQNQELDSDSISVYRCLDCNGIFLGNYNLEYEAEMYEYYKLYQGKSAEVLFNPLTALSYHKVLDLFTKNTSGKSILDVGCGKGDFVYAGVKEGWNINGIELSQEAVDIAQKFLLPVTKLDFFSTEIRPASYDIVTMFEVLEHLPDPVNFIVRAAEIVKPGGLIYLTTPNYNSFDRRLQGISWPVIHREHLTYFTPQILHEIINKNTNLTILKSETRNISIQSLHRLKNIFRLKKKTTIKNLVYPIQSTDDVRKTIQSSFVLKILKRIINKFLDITSSGNTVVLLLKRSS